MAVTVVSPSPSSSPLSAESSFRELDDAFLQTQTRIWLGEVLHIRFDEEINIADLLADGALLFEVSEVLSKMLPIPAPEAPHLRVNESKALASSKSTMKYMPYLNVDSFLKMCKSLGVNGIDLFSPSDVVDKNNIRKVCMCIRSLSKKVRSRDINVPDFDSVICTVAMPTDMVDGIRKTLELSQCSSSHSNGQDSEKHSRVRYWQKRSNSDSTVSNGYSDIRDDADSKSIVAESNETIDYAICAKSPNIPDSQLIIAHSTLPELQLNTGDLEDDDLLQCEYLSPSITESVGSPSSVYYSDQELSGISSSLILASRTSGIYCESQDELKMGGVNHVPIDWGDLSLDDDCRDPDIDEVGLVSHDKDNADAADCCSGGTPPNLENEQANNEAAKHEMLACELRPGVGEPYSYRMVKDNHLSPQLIQTDVSSHAENLDSTFNDGNDASQVSTKDSNDAIVGSGIHPSMIKNDKSCDVNMFTSDHTIECNNNNFGHNASDSVDMPNMDMNYLPCMVATKDNTICSDQDNQDTPEVFEVHEIQDPNMNNGKLVNVEDIPCVDKFTTNLHYSHLEAKGLENIEAHKHNQCAEKMEKGMSEDKGDDKEKPQKKPQKKLLKLVVKGTALVGFAVFLLHLRKNSRGHIPKVNKQSVEIPKENMPKKLSSQKTEKGGKSSSAYPAKKLHLGI